MRASCSREEDAKSNWSCCAAGAEGAVTFVMSAGMVSISLGHTAGVYTERPSSVSVERSADVTPSPKTKTKATARYT